MAKKERKVDVHKIDNSILKLNSLFGDVIDNINQSTYKTDSRNEKEIKRINKSVTSVINEEIDDLKDFTGNDIATFLLKSFNHADRDKSKSFSEVGGMKEIDELFEGSNSDIFGAFSERYRSKALLYEDLEIISSQLIELAEAVDVTRDSIVTADDIGSTVSRTISFKNSLESDTDKESFMRIIEEVEKKLKLPSKIRNHIVPKTLKFGKYYAYIIPQSKLFEKMQKEKIKDVKTMESYLTDEDTLKFVCENVSIIEDDRQVMGFAPKVKKSANETIKTAMREMGESINISNLDIPLPLIENTGMVDAMSDLSQYNSGFSKVKGKKKGVSLTSDAVIDMKAKADKVEDFSFIEDVYIKLIDPKKIIPVKVMDFTIGYYYIHDQAPVAKKGLFNSSISLMKEDKITEKDIVNKISEKIVKAFDKSYLESNVEFKDLVLNALLFNDSYKKKLHFQFIPAEYMCEFKVNEDENGEGTSMLIKSLFYGKLYLALLMFNTITHLSKSTDTKVYYIKNSGIDKNVVNKTMEVARDIKSKQINFNDLLNYNSMYSKVGAGKEIFMPVGKSGEKGIEFDILSGQQVDMQNEFMETLRHGYINGSGVPSVIMNYINEADYAKTLVMANAKHLGRAINYQLDFNDDIGQMYKMILKHSTNIPEEVVASLDYILTPPKTLNNNNISDITSYAENIVEFLTKFSIGDEGEQPENIGTIKDLFKNKLVKDVAPMLPWEEIEEMLEQSKLEAKAIAIKKGDGNDTSQSSDY